MSTGGSQCPNYLRLVCHSLLPPDQAKTVAVPAQLIQQGHADMAAYVAAAPVHRGRLAPLQRVTLWLMHNKHVATAADLALELVRWAPNTQNLCIVELYCDVSIKNPAFW